MQKRRKYFIFMTRKLSKLAVITLRNIKSTRQQRENVNEAAEIINSLHMLMIFFFLLLRRNIESSRKSLRPAVELFSGSFGATLTK